MPAEKDFITEPERRIPVRFEADVVVCGGGVAGIAAAVCAGRLGLKTVMVEQSGMPGGMMTRMLSGLQDCRNKGGFVREFVRGLEERGLTDPSVSWCTKYNRFPVPAYLDELLADAGVRPLYLCGAAAPVMDGNRITGVITESKSGRTAIRVRMVIDATGDGDIAVRAGAAFRMGRSSDGLCQPASLSQLFLEYSGDKKDKPEFKNDIRKASDAAGIPVWYDNVRLAPLPGTGQVNDCVMSHTVASDFTDATVLSDALIEMRRQSAALFRMFKNHVPGFENAVAGPVCDLPGVRESRRIECDVMITAADTEKGTLREDGLFTVTQALDFHRMTAEEPAITVTHVKPYRIPLGALLPKGIENLVVAGRCIGGDHEPLAGYRVAGNCMAMGEAAAIAAANAFKNKTVIREVSSADVAREMRARGY